MRRLRVSIEEGADDLAELFSDLGALELNRGAKRVTAAFDAEQPRGLEDRVEQFLHLIDRDDRAVLETALDGGPWLEGWRAIFRGADVGRFRIRPPWIEPPADGVPVIVEPRGAFGTGQHPATELALRLLDLAVDGRSGQSMIDVGAGSGVLSVAAAKCGLRPSAVEIEPRARAACARTALANGLQIELLDTEGRFDLVVANLPAPTLLELMPRLRALGDALLVSGPRIEEWPQIRDAIGGEPRTVEDGAWIAGLVQLR
jgi:ribosomal protein L11 methyltransferase